MEEEILNRMQALPERRNPFDEGIAKAVSNSRSNLGMNRDQEHRAINNALLALGNGLAKEPIQRGFKNNLGVFGRAMNPALSAYNTSEDTAIAENQNIANQILQHQRAEQALVDKREENAWNRKFQERQLEEQKRHHNLLDNFKKQEREEKSLLNNFKLSKGEREKIEKEKEFEHMSQTAEKLVRDLGSEGERSLWAKKFRPKFSNQEYTPEQMRILVAGELLKGKLFKAMGYQSTPEFLHVPDIHPDKGIEANLASIDTMRKMLMQKTQAENTSPADEGVKNVNNGDRVLMVDPETGERDYIPRNRVEEAINIDGLQVVDE